MNFHVDALNRAFEQKKDKKPNYSIRLFAQSLKIHPSSLSHILNGKRQIPTSKVEEIASLLDLKNEEYDLFISSALRHKFEKLSPRLEAKKYIEEAIFENFIVDYRYPLILCLMEIKAFDGTLDWLSLKSGINHLDVFDILCELESLGLVKSRGHKYMATGEYTKTKTGRFSEIIQMSHKRHLELAENKLDVPVELREFRFTTMAINSKKIEEFKVLAKEFIRKAEDLLEDDNRDTVYRLGLQFFPLKESISSK